MLDHVIRAADVNLDYAKRLLADVPDENMCLQPAPGMNHAAWVLGHLAFVFDSMNKVFGHPSGLESRWYELFKVGTQPHSDRALYPTKQELWDAYERTYRRIVDSIRSAPAEEFDKEFPNPKLRPLLPTVGIAMVHVLTTHQGIHLGQLSAWRRALGMPPAGVN